jgi:hypothetical protein
MPLTIIASVFAGLIGLGILFIGACFLLAPRTAAAGYGIPVSDPMGSADAYLAAKGVRDIVSGLLVLILLAARSPQVLGWVLLAATLIPLGDALIVLRHQGSRTIAYGVHGATADFKVVTAVLLLLSPA